LDNCSDLIKKEGILAYSTCSITKEENEMVIEKFLIHHPNFELTETCPRMGSSSFMGYQGPKRFYPHIDGSYGFFVAKLKRTD
jgi:16S rRNA (cytosine967-C5)-methyltransferase